MRIRSPSVSSETRSRLESRAGLRTTRPMLITPVVMATPWPPWSGEGEGDVARGWRKWVVKVKEPWPFNAACEHLGVVNCGLMGWIVEGGGVRSWVSPASVGRWNLQNTGWGVGTCRLGGAVGRVGWVEQWDV